MPIQSRYGRFSNIFTALTVLVTVFTACFQTAGAQPSLDEAEDIVADALQMRSDGLLEEAASSLERFRLDYPDHIMAGTAMYYQAEIALQLGRSGEAVDLLSLFRRRYPAHPLAFEAEVALAAHFLETDERERALEMMERVLEQRPPPELAARVLYQMGEAAVQVEDYDEAITYFRRAAEGYRETPTAPIALYAIGFTQMRRGRYEDAARAFENLTSRYPNSSYARIVGIALAEVYYEMGDYERAIREFEEQLPGLGPEARERATFLLAESYNQVGDSENAIIYYRRFTDGSPDSPYYDQALYGLAWHYHFEGIHEWAADYFEQARQSEDEDLAARATYYEAVNRSLFRQPESAIDLYREFLFQWPNHELAPHAQLELGVELYGLRQWREAHEAFGEVASVYPESDVVGEALYYRGNTAVALGDYDAALDNFDRAVSQGAAPPELADEIRFQRAWLQYRNQDYREAEQAFTNHYEENPSGPRAEESLFWAAESAYQLGRYNVAERRFRQYLSSYRSGKHVEAANYALGWTYFRTGRYEEAAGAFRRFLNAYRSGDESVPYRADARLRLADSYYAMKRYGDAIAAYTEAASDGHEYAAYQIAQAHYNSGNPGRAMASFRSLISDYPDGEWVQEATYSIGYIQFQNEQYEEAIDTYQSLIDRYPRDPLAARAQYGIGDAYFNAGRLSEATQAYMAVLERYPESPYVADAAAGMQYALLAQGDERMSAAVIDSFATRNPGSPVVAQLRFRQAEVRYQSGDRTGALSDFQVFLEQHQGHDLAADAYFYIGDIYQDRHDEERARSAFARVVNDYPASSRAAEAAWRLGNLHLEAGRSTEALDAFQRMESAPGLTGSEMARAQFGQGVALAELGRINEAERVLRASIDAGGDSDDALPGMLGMARLYERTNRTAEAADLYRQVGDRSKDEIGAEALYRLGDLQARGGNAAAALETFSRIPALFLGFDDWVASAYIAQARLFAAAGQTGEAVRLYERVTSDYRGTPHAQTAEREKSGL